ncbi:MAG TPA: GNAT family N-acetyltransferase [Lachnospiraceae bacterium]|nr:GNAT family N-acetyltransferase [Lachnospiraceae bacterium]
MYKENSFIKLKNFTDNAKQLLSYTPLQYMIDAVCENPRIAEVYVDREEEPKVCVMLLGHYLFVGGHVDEQVHEAILQEVLPMEKRKQLGCLIVFYESEDFAGLLKGSFERVYPDERSLYLRNPGYKEMNGSHLIGITRITTTLLESDASNLEMITEEVLGTGTYEDMEDFCKRGIGYTLVVDEKVCGFCTSEYPCRNALAIGIEVEEEYQNKGYAKAMTRSFLNQATERGLDTYWECWKRNEMSVKTALSCGFKKVSDYPVLFIDFTEE